ncbi:hypothetical protein KTE69_14020 [Burkholderia multivorans]|uniref:hypothetical protein n=1 Tax=Burkholderia multivorans TaxID=87883 RepID=UPI000CFF4E7C|nr:hypothetical protein [Burkholderia multivorans]MBU9369486.1 hypothetical protein [Burkholderia multivorans]PRD90421.1 hypothetical protein C6P76_03915 [Burkholderia multivorans]
MRVRSNLEVLVPLAIFLALCFAFFPESIDDAYITLRYSLNFATGNGPVFNPGEHVEGYSNFTWMAILAAADKLSLSMPIVMKVLSVIAGLCTIIIVGEKAKSEFGRLSSLSCALILAASTFFAMWSTDGLETMFYTCLVSALAVILTQPTVRPALIGCLGAAIALTRPEGIMFGLLAGAYVTYRRGIKDGASVFLPILIGVGGYEIFRLSYFGELVSNTALAKVHTTPRVILRGLTYLYDFNAESGYVLLPLALAGAIIHRRTAIAQIASSFIGAQILFLAVSGGDFMYGYRFVMPIFPLIALMATSILFQVGSEIYAAARFGWAFTVLWIVAFQYHALPPKHFALDNLTERRSTHFQVARYIDSLTTSSDTVVLSEAGIIPYGIRARVYDYLGLTSPYWMVFGRNGLDVEKALAGNPKIIILMFVVHDDGKLVPRMWTDQQISESNNFKKYYRKKASFMLDPAASYLDQIYYKYARDAKKIFFVVYERT